MITAKRAHEIEERIEELQEEIETLHVELQTASQLEAERWSSTRKSKERREERDNWFKALYKTHLTGGEIACLPNVDIGDARVRQIGNEEFSPSPESLQQYSQARREEFESWVAVLRRDELLSGHDISRLPHVPANQTTVNAIANERIRDPGVYPASPADD